MKYCSSCGKELNNEEKFCSSCGRKCVVNDELVSTSTEEHLDIAEENESQFEFTDNLSNPYKNKSKTKQKKGKFVLVTSLLLVLAVMFTLGAILFKKTSVGSTSEYYVQSTYEFSEGLAWVSIYTKTIFVPSKPQYACIDTDGEIMFMLDVDCSLPTPFVNGVSSYTDQNNIYTVVDNNGNVVFSSADGLYDGIIASGDGYYAVYLYKEGFSSSGYYIKVIDPQGEVRKIFSGLEDDIPDIVYCGEGIFAYCTWSSVAGSDDYRFYNANTKSWFNVKGIADNNDLSNIFVDGVALLERGTGRMGDIPILIYSDGTVKELDITGYSFYEYGKIADGGFVFASYYDEVETLMFYDIAKERVVNLGNYGERVKLDTIKSLRFDSGYLLLPLEGADGKSYYTILDKSGTSLFSPVECVSVKSLNEDRIGLQTTTGTILNGRGEVVAENIMGITSLSFNDGWSVYANSSNYIDTNGNLMFKNGILNTN